MTLVGWLGGLHRYFRSVRVQKEAEGPGVGQSAGRDLPAVTPRIRQATVVRTDLVGQLVGSLIKRPASEARRVAYFSRSRVSSPSPSPSSLPPTTGASFSSRMAAGKPSLLAWGDYLGKPPPQFNCDYYPLSDGVL